MLRHVPVPGGELAVEVLDGDTAPVLAIHGISSQRRLWDWLLQEMPGLSLIAPDLRGRGDSFAVEGRSDMARHADDMVAVLDALGLDAVHVVGMSMGGFVAIKLATAHPERVRSIVLVDGGFPMPTPPGLTPEAVPAVFADRLARLDQEWASVEDYMAFFTANTAPLLTQDDVLRGYLAHDLDGGRVRLSGEALVSDATDIYFGEVHWRELTHPVRLLAAEWAGGKDTPGAYSDDVIAQLKAQLPNLVTVVRVPAVDHAASIMSPAGAKATAALITEALA